MMCCTCYAVTVDRGLCIRVPHTAKVATAVRCQSAAGHVAHAAPTTHLQSLAIQNFALVSDEKVIFSPGLNVISGESGSGKSVLLQALNVVMGMPVGKDMIRDPEVQAGNHV